MHSNRFNKIFGYCLLVHLYLPVQETIGNVGGESSSFIFHVLLFSHNRKVFSEALFYVKKGLIRSRV